MHFDAENLFSENQAITADTVSTNVIDMGAKTNLAGGTPIEVHAQVTEDFATCDDLTVEIEESDTENFASSKVIASSGAVPLAQLKAGEILPLAYLPRSTGQFYRLKYTVGGADATAGKVYAGITHGRQTNGV